MLISISRRTLLLASALLLGSARFAAAQDKRVPLTIYVVHATKPVGGRFIDTPQSPKLGYIAAKPDLTIAHLVRATSAKDRPSLEVQLRDADARKLTALTTKARGQKILVMLGDKPVMAPQINQPVTTATVQLPRTVEAAVKRLVD